MSAPLFTWTPSYSAQATIKPNIRKAQFGDGYEQRSANGINTIKEEWSLAFTRPDAEIKEIDTFLRARGGVESFDWETPNGEIKRFVCSEEWSIKHVNLGVKELTAKFSQVFEA